jgi:multisubunit Na+/H+ antiporter MnhB subunit
MGMIIVAAIIVIAVAISYIASRSKNEPRRKLLEYALILAFMFVLTGGVLAYLTDHVKSASGYRGLLRPDGIR